VRELLAPRSISFFEAFIFIIIVGYFVRKGKRDDTKGEESLRRAARAENQFFSYWPLLWGCWFLLYLALGMQQSSIPIFLNAYSVGENFLNNLTGLAFFGMYYELAEKTANAPQSPASYLWLPILMVLTVVAVAEYSLSTRFPDVAPQIGYC